MPAAAENPQHIVLARFLTPADLRGGSAIIDRDGPDGDIRGGGVVRLQARSSGTAAAGAGAGRPFGKQGDRLVGLERLRRCAAPGRWAPRAVLAPDVERVVLVGEPVDDRMAELILGHERAAGRAGEDQDVEPADMVGDQQGVRAGRVRRRRGPGRRRSTPLRRGSGAARASGRRTAWMQMRAAADEQPAASAAIRATASRRETARGLAVAVEGDAVELHPVVDEPEAELLGDPLLQLFQLLVDELDDLAGLDVDQMVVVRFGRRFVARRGRRRIRGARGSRPPRTGGPSGRRSRSRFWGRSPRRARAASRRPDGPRCRRGPGR